MISHVFLRLDSASREDMLTDAAVNVLAAGARKVLTDLLAHLEGREARPRSA